ncbi:uncharacterized protein LOC133205078 [Saccostrea echinata]|uniref:uncharacterized protein LOC133205078 n=1 Tax=Saccostrea echinata TaxID=191078 RepID=UPI002A801091|nr:uncharacterized protein LOC133205078 [Saccostrea echinata]
MCNDVNVSDCGDVVSREISPTTTPLTTTVPPYKWSFRSYFSISAYDQSDMISDADLYSKCLPNQMYDSSQKTCRNLTCFPGKTPLNDTCVSLLASTDNLRYTLPIKIKLTTFMKKCGDGVFKNVLVSPLLTCKQIVLKGCEFGVPWTKIRTKFAYLGLSLSSNHFEADATVELRVCASDISIYKETLKVMGLIDEGMVIMSVLSHLSWLLLFFWLQVCSFHMFRVFRQDRRTENSDRYIRKTITKYFSYAFGSSSFIVSCNLIISLIHSNGDSTGYDKASSLMTHKISFIVTLILPLTLICLTNIMFYILTAYKIYSSPDIENTSGNRIQFTVYVKLFSLTGLSWLLQIVDTFVEVSILSYFLAILNGLQGFFIFLSYVCNKRVWDLYKKACGSFISDQSRTSSGMVTNSNEK